MKGVPALWIHIIPVYANVWFLAAMADMPQAALSISEEHSHRTGRSGGGRRKTGEKKCGVALRLYIALGMVLRC